MPKGKKAKKTGKKKASIKKEKTEALEAEFVEIKNALESTVPVLGALNIPLTEKTGLEKSFKRKMEIETELERRKKKRK